VLDTFFEDYTEIFSWIRPRAGSMAFPRFLKGNIDTFCDDLVKKAGVLLLPGSVYDDNANHFRLGLGRKNLPTAILRLKEYLKNAF